MGRQIDRWVDKEMGKWTDGKTDRQKKTIRPVWGSTDKWTREQTINGYTDRAE
jgi:hypothetical protein